MFLGCVFLCIDRQYRPQYWFIIALDKRGWYQVNIFLFLHENICCGYSLEAPQWGALMNTLNICFCGEIRIKSKVFRWKSTLSSVIYNFKSNYLIQEKCSKNLSRTVSSGAALCHFRIRSAIANTLPRLHKHASWPVSSLFWKGVLYFPFGDNCFMLQRKSHPSAPPLQIAISGRLANGAVHISPNRTFLLYKQE